MGKGRQMSDEEHQYERAVNPLPDVVIGLALIIGVIEIVLTLAGQGWIGGPAAVGWRSNILNAYAFSAGIQDRVLGLGDLSFNMLRRYVTYAFVHASVTQAAFAIVIILALGKFIGEAWRRQSILIVFFAATIAGAVVYGAITPSNYPLFGAYPGIYGMIGAYTYLLWLRLDRDGGPRWRAFGLIGFFLLLQIVWALAMRLTVDLGWTSQDPTPYMLYDGISDLGGFAVGLALSPVLGPGGWSVFVERLRQRSD